MKRFHVHLRVDDLAANIQFYKALFSREPVMEREDYAKWMLDDPKLNFALSTHEAERGISHIGIEFEDLQELELLQAKLIANKEIAKAVQASQNQVNCCYKKSNKHWLLDPQQVAWEMFHSYESTHDYGFSDTMETIKEGNGA